MPYCCRCLLLLTGLSVHRMEQECLQRWINTRAGVRRDGQEERHRCEVCRAPYNVSVDAKLGKGKLCSMASWGQYCTCVLMLLMFVMLAFVIWVYINSEEYKNEETADANWVLWSLTAATGLLFVSTMKKIYERWRDVNVTETVQVNERADPDAAAVLPVEQSVQGALLAAPAETFAPEGSASMLLHAAAVEMDVEQSVAEVDPRVATSV